MDSSARTPLPPRSRVEGKLPLPVRLRMDVLPPVMVKELRQALRDRGLRLVLVVSHVILLLSAVLAMTDIDIAVMSALVTAAVLVMVLCVLLPARNLSALAEERRQGTLEPLMLTDISAQKVVWQKWGGTVALSFLTCLSVIPYLPVLAYVSGWRQEIPELLLLLFQLWVLSAALTGFLTGLSWVSSWLVRGTIALPLLGFAGWGYGMNLVRFAATESRGESHGGLLWLGSAVMVYTLGLAASSFSPAAQNCITPMRLAACAALLPLALVMSAGTPGAAALAQLTGMALLGVTLHAMLESGGRPATVYAAFTRRGLPGRAAAWLVAPGPVSGIFWSLLLWGVFALCVRAGSVDDGGALGWMSLTLATAAILYLCPARFRNPGGVISFIVAFAVLAAAVRLLALLLESPALDRAAAGLPNLPFLAAAGPSVAALPVSSVCAAWLFLTALRGAPEFLAALRASAVSPVSSSTP